MQRYAPAPFTSASVRDLPERAAHVRLSQRGVLLLPLPVLAVGTTAGFPAATPYAAVAAIILISALAYALVLVRWPGGRKAGAGEALAVANARLRECTAHSDATLAVVSTFCSSARLSEALDIALGVLAKAVGARFAMVGLPDPEGGRLQVLRMIDAGAGRVDPDPHLISELGLEGPTPGVIAMREARPVVVEDLLAEQGHPLRPAYENYGIRSLIAVPVSQPGDSSGGALVVASTEARPFSEEQVAFLRSAAALIGGAPAKALLLEELENRANERTFELIKAPQQVLGAGRLAAMGELAAGVAHELNTPLGTILGYLQLAEERLSPSAEDGTAVRRYVGIICQEADRCSTIVRNRLQFTRQSSTDFVPTDVSVLVDHAIQLVAHHLEVNRVGTVVRNNDGGPFIVNARPQELIQVMTNLLINVQQSMSSGGEVSITIGPSSAPETIEIAFADTGAGIPPENLDRIFGPFFTTKVSRGTGLGLTLSYGIVQQHGGDIAVESVVGRGTTVRVVLPRAAQSGNAKGVQL